MPGDLFVLVRFETATNLLYTKLSLSGVHLRYAMGAGADNALSPICKFLMPQARPHGGLAVPR